MLWTAPLVALPPTSQQPQAGQWEGEEEGRQAGRQAGQPAPFLVPPPPLAFSPQDQYVSCLLLTAGPGSRVTISPLFLVHVLF